MKLKIGVLREEKENPDRRVPLTPLICSELLKQNLGISVVIQPSPYRCYSDAEYRSFGLNVSEDLSECYVLMGVKEIPVSKLIPNKKYLFFSHTIKKQAHNKGLMNALIKNKIQMIDYETLTDASYNRIIGFGRYAGIVGAYNAILGYGIKYDLFQLKPANQCRDKAEMEEELKRAKLPNIKIVVTGGGRVANGVYEILSCLHIRKITPEEFLMGNFKEPVYCQLNPRDYVERAHDHNFDLHDFIKHPEGFVSKFEPFTKAADIYISAHYWAKNSPNMFNLDDVKNPNFRISVLADITCDIGGSIPTTIRSSKIGDAFYGFNLLTHQEDVPFSKETLCVMAVDNLPCELPRNASDDFAKDLKERVIPSFLNDDKEQIIERASICKNGKLMPAFEYLTDYAY